MNKWSIHKMSDITRLVTDGKHGDCEDEEGSGYYFLSSKDLRDGKLQYDKPRQITYSGFLETHRRTNLEPGDILLTNCGASIGRVGMAQNDPRVYKTTFQKSISVIKPNRSIIRGKYLYYFLLCNSDLLVHLGDGTAQPNLLIGDIKRIEVPVPDDFIQQRIVTILSAYDDLIENNLRRIKILEEMAQNLYREWFVKFRFPGHEKARFVDSPLGKIPAGWEVIKLGDLIEIRKGKSITKNTVVNGPIPVVAGGLNPAYYHNESNTRQPVITISASGANAGYVCLYHENVWASDCSVIDFNTTTYVYFYYLQLKNRYIEINRLQRGAAQPHVYPNDLMNLDAVRTPISILDAFCEYIKPIFNMIRTLTFKNINLRTTRDLLLPKLISGEVDVSELDIRVPGEVA